MKLEKVMKPKLEDVEKIVAVDREVISIDIRRDFIKKAVEEDRCIVVKSDNKIVGFLIFDTNFFDCSFISMIIVSSTARRKGYATFLMDYFVNISHTKKKFHQPIDQTKICKKF